MIRRTFSIALLKKTPLHVLQRAVGTILAFLIVIIYKGTTRLINQNHKSSYGTLSHQAIVMLDANFLYWFHKSVSGDMSTYPSVTGTLLITSSF